MDTTPKLPQPAVASSNAPEFDLDHIFSYHAPKPDDLPKFVKLRDGAKVLAALIIELVPPGADQSAAIRLVRDAIATANSALALGGRLHKLPPPKAEPRKPTT